MKNLIALMLVVCSTVPALAAKESGKEFNFKFVYKGEKLAVSRAASSYEEAFVIAAQDCFNHYTETSGSQKVSEQMGLAVIDVCANPRF